MDDSELNSLLDELISLSKETEWVEFKLNRADPEEIGEYLSALSNSAALHKKEAGYIVWGIQDAPGTFVGTTFRPRDAKVGNEELENWLARLLSPRVDFRIHEFTCGGARAVIIEIQPALSAPVSFKGVEFIRIGSYKKKLRDFPEKERALWSLFTKMPFERGLAQRNVTSDEVLSLIAYPAFFELMGQALPRDRSGTLERLLQEKVLQKKGGDKYNITNLGAILFAADLSEFDSLARKAIRVIVYKGKSRVETVRERLGQRGYAVGFEGLIDYINSQLPRNEEIGRAFRKDVPMFPELAIRELVANALIHQDFNMKGTGPMVEIFADRIEITNPGQPLIDTLRFVDEPPQSRNEALAASMRRMNICEERGSGIDKVVFQTELHQLPAPEFSATKQHTKAVLFGPRTFREMDKGDKIRTCYLHACLRYVSSDRMTNASLRKRFGIAEGNYALASRIIRDTADAKLVKPYDPDSTSKKYASYVPFWA